MIEWEQIKRGEENICYLQSGKSQYIDYTENESEEELLKKISAYY